MEGSLPAVRAAIGIMSLTMAMVLGIAIVTAQSAWVCLPAGACTACLHPTAVTTPPIMASVMVMVVVEKEEGVITGMPPTL